ncbi:Uncharacterised protein [Candidatus Gugararchaeum adminiculabundum]|nr:Uncharacterised protein [Candidatus Gugararchaeum adminiculabundum]
MRARFFIFVFAFAIIFAGTAFAWMSSQGAECKQSCQDDYNTGVTNAQALADARQFYSGDTSSNCGNLRESRAGARSSCIDNLRGIPDGGPGYPGTQGCLSGCNDDACTAGCDAQFQTCCLAAAKDSYQIWYDECVAGCPAEQTDLCAVRDIPCPTLVCENRMLKWDGQCDHATGQCTFGSNKECYYGCNAGADDCNPEPEINTPPPTQGCTNSCSPYEDQMSDCSCVRKTCATQCPAEDTQAPYPDCSCEPANKCANKVCPNYCAQSLAKNGQKNDYDIAKNTGDCDPATGECVDYAEEECSAGCAMTTASIPEAYCIEDCDNGKDDDYKNGADCEDKPACANSPYCSCQLVEQNYGSSGGSTLKIIVAGYRFAPRSFDTTFKERDAQIIADAKEVGTALGINEPFREMNFEIYATRMPMEAASAGRSDILAKCSKESKISGDLTISINYIDGLDPNSYKFSDHVDMYMATTPRKDFQATMIHELGHAFAGLWDEYNISTLNLGSVDETRAYVRDQITSRRNCAVFTHVEGLSISELEQCQSYFNQFNGVSYRCYKGCSWEQYWRPSEKSVMLYPDETPDFNEISKSIVRDMIKQWTQPAATPISIPIPKGSTGKRPEPYK